MHKFKDNIVYYTIMKKSEINIQNDNFPKICNNKKLETKQAYYILFKMLDYFNLEYPDISISNYGKPYFLDSNIYFNYSHSKNYIICAISNKEIGTDIEEGRTINDLVANKYLDNLKDNKERLKLWVRKEAYSKLYGIGFKIGFEKIKLNNLLEKESLIKNNKDYIFAIYSDNKQCKLINIKK